MTISPDLENSLNSLPTQGEEEDRGDLLLLPDQLAENLFLSTFLPAPSRSTQTNRENWSKRTLKIPSDGFIPEIKLDIYIK